MYLLMPHSFKNVVLKAELNEKSGWGQTVISGNVWSPLNSIDNFVPCGSSMYLYKQLYVWYPTNKIHEMIMIQFIIILMILVACNLSSIRFMTDQKSLFGYKHCFCWSLKWLLFYILLQILMNILKYFNKIEDLPCAV